MRVNHVVAAKSTGIGPVNLKLDPQSPPSESADQLTRRPRAAAIDNRVRPPTLGRNRIQVVLRHIINLSRHSGRTIHLSSARGHPVPVVVQGGRATLKVMEAVIVDAERNS